MFPTIVRSIICIQIIYIYIYIHYISSTYLNQLYLDICISKKVRSLYPTKIHTSNTPCFLVSPAFSLDFLQKRLTTANANQLPKKRKGTFGKVRYIDQLPGRGCHLPRAKTVSTKAFWMCPPLGQCRKCDRIKGEVIGSVGYKPIPWEPTCNLHF